MSKPPTIGKSPALGKSPNISPEEFQRMVYVYQLMRDQQNVITEQLEFVQSQLMGINLSKTTLEGLKNATPGMDIIVPLGSVAFTHAKIVDPNKVLVNVSKSIVLEKSLANGIIDLDRNLEYYKRLEQKLSTQLQETGKKLEELEPQINQIYESMQQRR